MSRQKHFNPMARHLDKSNRVDKVIDVPFDTVIHETKLAWLLGFDDGREEWFPKSMCELYENDNIIVVPSHIAKEKGFD